MVWSTLSMQTNIAKKLEKYLIQKKMAVVQKMHSTGIISTYHMVSSAELVDNWPVDILAYERMEVWQQKKEDVLLSI